MAKKALLAGLLLVLPACAPAPCDDAACLLADDLSRAALGVRAPADDDVWIVGSSPAEEPAGGPLLAHWGGVAWERIDTSLWPGLELWSTWASDDEVVAVGSDGTILEFDRTTRVLRQVEQIGAGSIFFAVWGGEPSDLWAVGRGPELPDVDGDGFDEPGLPLLWRRLDGTWAPWSDPIYDGVSGEQPLAVHGRSRDDLWIAGTGGLVRHWDGRELRSIPPITEEGEHDSVVTIDGGGERPLAVGARGDVLYEWDGGRWRVEQPDPTARFHGLCTASDGRAVAVGEMGARAMREHGVWAPDYARGVEPVTSGDFHACAFAPSGALWAVGGWFVSRPLGRGFVTYTGPGEVATLE